MDDAREVIDGLPAILDVLRQGNVRELVVRDGDVQVRVHRTPSVVVRESQEPVPIPEPQFIAVTAPLVGTFYRAGRPDAPPLVEEGATVEQGTVVGVVEALQMPTEIEAGCAGIVSRILVVDGQPVEYGQVLLEVTPSG